MEDLIVILVIATILYFAIKPIIKFKKEKGSGISCYKCSQYKDGSCNKS